MELRCRTQFFRERKERRMKLAPMNYHYLRYPVRKFLDKVADSPFDSIDLYCSAPQLNMFDYTLGTLLELDREIRERGLSVMAVTPENCVYPVNFCTQDEMGNRMGDNFRNLDGGVTFWYSNDRIYECIICYRTDLDQQVRNSVIIEEIYNGLGPIQDTDLRPDSIIYSGYSIPQSMTEIDELLLKLLYHPDMQCGMNAEECAAVIRRLYY
jgi:hypothetical protein